MASTSVGPDAGGQQAGADSPVGDGDYVVQQGDCLESIAFARGLPWKKIWDHPRNAAFKIAGRDPNILLPGDRLFVPDPEPKSVSKATDGSHTFRCKGVKSLLRIRVVEWQANADGTYSAAPRVNVPYVLIVEGESFSGQTYADGWIRQNIPPDARKGTLIVEPGTERAYQVDLFLGHLDPVTSDSGVCQRLANLGFASSLELDANSPELQDAVSAFQAAQGLEATGILDPQSRNKLQEVHGS